MNAKPTRTVARGVQRPATRARDRRADQHAGDQRHEQPGEAPGRYAQEVDEERGRDGDVDEERAEVERRNEREQQELGAVEHRAVVAPHRARMQGLPVRACAERFGQRCVRSTASVASTNTEKHPEDRAPAERLSSNAADDRRDRRRDAEHHRDLRHQPLRFGAVETVADHRAADHQPRSPPRAPAARGTATATRCCRRSRSRASRPRRSRAPPA